MNTSGSNSPRYLAYVVAQGATSVGEMQERDRQRYPPGKMSGFTRWMDEQLAAWRRDNDRAPHSPLSAQDHRHFDAWLAERVIARPSPLTTISQ